ncbi:MAG: DNA polymerase IV, partial [Chloroflexi bacterium]|nr:DNA polymerase IV [Chloroflexota bacterium]
MRVGCLFFPHFSVQVEARDNSAIPGKPIIIGGFPHELKPVHDASKEAIKHGIQRGMPLRQAYALCPRGLFLPLAEEKYNCAFTQVLSLLSRYSPTIEATATEHAFLDVTYEPDETRFIRAVDETIERETGFHASMAIASNKFVALTASLVASTGQALVIPEGEEKEFLQDLPVD